jgi:beta-mannanase
MKKNRLYIIFIAFALTSFLAAIYAYQHRQKIVQILKEKPKNTIEQNNSEPILAVFSFEDDFENHNIENFLHFTLKLYNTKKWGIEKEVLTQIPDSIPILITIETWDGTRIFSTYNNPLNFLLKGYYDHIIELMCKEWIGTRPNVYIRLNPEMEVPVNFYPWQYSSYLNYINAFRHFSEVCQKNAPQVKTVWGPAGYPGTLELYPGEEWIDAATVTIKSESEMYLDVYPKNYPVAYDIKRRIHRLRFMNKPIFVLGSKNAANDSVNQQLISEISQYITNNKQVIYSEENFKSPEPDKTTGLNKNFEIGFHDPNLLLTNEKPVTVEHIFADFNNILDGTLEKLFNDVVNRGHKVIVTIEPSRNSIGVNDRNVLRDIISGGYDSEIKQLYSILTSTNQQVYLRFAHEMEIPILRYPWQSQDPVEYIHAFRYFMNFMNPWPENIKKVWGPAGDRGSIEWYPGNDVVDYVSIAIYGLPDKNITDPEKQESFSTIFNRKSWRMRFIDKPIFITEFGVKGPEEYQTKWLINAAQVIRENPQIVGINYFNMTDTPKAWGEIKPPDWSISRESFYTFLKVLKKE